MIQVFFKLKYNSYRIFHYKFYHKLRIGCASGFWGDTSVSVPQLIYKGKLNFLVFDYLSEITMSLLAKAKVNDPTKGFTPDFISIAQYASELKKQGIRVIANAGGINPDACYNELKKCLEKSGVNMKIAIIKGDDCMDKNDLLNQMENFDDEKLPKSNLLSSNIYLGASPIKFALDKGADIVITGRCVDSALVLGPLMHHFKWDNNDLDKLAAGSLAGHLIECGAQVTGGIFTDCFSVPDWWNIGFPIVEVEQNGEFIVTKPENTGGIVTSATVKEQLVYEIGNPSEYVLPDVICDFTSVTVTDIGNDQVKVSGAKGINPPITFKVSSTSLENYRLTAVAVVVGKDAVKKARLTAENILKRVRGILKVLKISDFSRWNISVVGGEDSYGNAKNLSVTEEVREAVIWLAVEHSELKPLKILSSEIAPAGTGMAPGLTGLIGGRPKISPILKLYSSLINKDKVNVLVKINSEEFSLPPEKVNIINSNLCKESLNISKSDCQKLSGSFILRDLAYARSGDKGNTCNIGVVSRNSDAWEIIKMNLTVNVVGSYLNHVFPNNNWRGNIERYELPGIKALNFVLKNSLDGGGVSSLRFDPQGKALAQILLDLKF